MGRGKKWTHRESTKKTSAPSNVQISNCLRRIYTLMTISVFKFIFQCLQVLCGAKKKHTHTHQHIRIWNNKNAIVSAVCLGESKPYKKKNSPICRICAPIKFIMLTMHRQLFGKFNREMNNLNFIPMNLRAMVSVAKAKIQATPRHWSAPAPPPNCAHGCW